MKNKSIVMRVEILVLLAVGLVKSTKTGNNDEDKVFVPTTEWNDINEGMCE